jgi:chemotaxis response regulator CheB
MSASDGPKLSVTAPAEVDDMEHGLERRGRPWRAPSLVLIAAARTEGLSIAARLLDALPDLSCPTVVSIRDVDPRDLRALVDGTRVRDVVDGARLDDARVWIAPTDRNTVVSEGSLRTDAPGHRVAGDLPSLGKLYHSVRLSFGSRVFAVVADAEHAGDAALRLLGDRGACVVRSLELEPSSESSHWSIPTIVGHLSDLVADPALEVAS